MPTWLQIGLVGKAHGLRGYFFVAQRLDPLPVDIGATVKIGKTEDGKSFEIEVSKMQGKRPVAKFKGIDKREEAEQLTGLGIWFPRGDVPEVGEDEYLWADIIGKPVVDKDGETLGEIQDVQNFGASDVVTIRQGKKYLELALVESYFDMNFKTDDPHLQLVVANDTFAELWRD